MRYPSRFPIQKVPKGQIVVIREKKGELLFIPFGVFTINPFTEYVKGMIPSEPVSIEFGAMTIISPRRNEQIVNFQPTITYQIENPESYMEIEKELQFQLSDDIFWLAMNEVTYSECTEIKDDEERMRGKIKCILDEKYHNYGITIDRFELNFNLIVC